MVLEIYYHLICIWLEARTRVFQQEKDNMKKSHKYFFIIERTQIWFVVGFAANFHCKTGLCNCVQNSFFFTNFYSYIFYSFFYFNWSYKIALLAMWSNYICCSFLATNDRWPTLRFRTKEWKDTCDYGFRSGDRVVIKERKKIWQNGLIFCRGKKGLGKRPTWC